MSWFQPSTKGVAVWTGQRFVLGASEPEGTFQTVILRSHSKKAVNPDDGRLRTSLGNTIMGQLVKSVAFAPKCLDHVFCIFPMSGLVSFATNLSSETCYVPGLFLVRCLD